MNIPSLLKTRQNRSRPVNQHAKRNAAATVTTQLNPPLTPRALLMSLSLDELWLTCRLFLHSTSSGAAGPRLTVSEPSHSLLTRSLLVPFQGLRLDLIFLA
jgi:hypothetical protein